MMPGLRSRAISLKSCHMAPAQPWRRQAVSARPQESPKFLHPRCVCGRVLSQASVSLPIPDKTGNGSVPVVERWRGKKEGQ